MTYLNVDPHTKFYQNPLSSFESETQRIRRTNTKIGITFPLLSVYAFNANNA
jgi:hypothetical protein